MEIKKCWYKEMTVYQIWPRSFKDGNGDGIGDLKGVLEKLDYLKWLGIDAIWFSPVYKSPQCDFGYDIADYRNIAPEYGTLDDFKAVLKGCKERGIKVIMDLVVNHTSTEHEWFQKSRMGGDDNPYKDYYFWRKGTGKDGKGYPNNWTSSFPGPAWTWDDERKEYYLHLFAVGQPDLNHDNPKVRQEVIDIYKYWLDMELEAIKAYDVWQEKNMYGKKTMGVVRTTYLIDENGIIEKAFGKVKAAENPAKMLEEL